MESNGNRASNGHVVPNAKPSLLRVGLTAGFLSLSQKSGKRLSSSVDNTPPPSKGGYSTVRADHDGGERDHDDDHDESYGTPQSLLSSSDEEAATLACIQSAQDIADNNRSSKALTTNDPISLAVLSAMGDYPEYSHSSKGVLVNVIDPTSGGLSNSFNSKNAPMMPPNVPDTPPSERPGGGGGKGLFGSFSRGGSDSHKNDTTNINNNTPGSSKHGDTTTTTSNYSSTTILSSLNIYSTLTQTFQENYNSTLHSLPYIHPRTNTRSSIPALPVRFGLQTQPQQDPAEWHAGPYCHVYIAAVENLEHYRNKVRPALRAFVNQIEGSGIAASTPGAPMGRKEMSVPSPGGGAGGASPSNVKGKKSANEKALAKAGLAVGKSIVAGNFGSRCIIVFVPIGSGSASSGASNTGNKGSSANLAGMGGRAGGGFGGFKGRKGQSGGVVPSNSNELNDDQSTNTSTTASTHDSRQAQHHAAAALPPGPIAHSSKEVKELYHKFLKDFPNGRTVILGTLLDHGGPQSVSPLKNQEWKAFLHNLGGAIVDGFSDRVRRYDEELRRLDSRRAAFVRKLSSDGALSSMSSNSKGKIGKQDDNNFDLSHFFLVKESLAFTYEQMQLFEEAKLQYEELNAFLPEDAWRQLAQQHNTNHNNRNRRGRITSRGGEDDNGNDNDDDATTGVSPADLAMAGDTSQFRRHIKLSSHDLRSVCKYVPRYMYSRIVRLLFQMGTPVEVIHQSKEFLTRGYRSRLLDADAEFRRRWRAEVEGAAVDCNRDVILERQRELRRERLRNEAEAEAWALGACWDVKCAAGYYFACAQTQGEESGDADGEGEGAGTKPRGKKNRRSAHNFIFVAGANDVVNEGPTTSPAGNIPPQKQRHIIVDERDNVAKTASAVDEAEASRCLAEIVEFGILRLVRLGDLALGEQRQRMHERGDEDGKVNEGDGAAVINPIRCATSERPADTLRPWEPWRKLQKLREEEMKSRRLTTGNDENESWPSILPIANDCDGNVSDINVSPWLHSALRTPSLYLQTYLELAQAAVSLNRTAGRHRFASRLEDHRSEVLISRGEYEMAAEVLRNNVATTAGGGASGAGPPGDQWTRAHYWRLFRLACCQRMSGDVLAYLETLTRSFDPRLKHVAPTKTEELFQMDLEAIITDAAVAEPRWGAFPFLETELNVVVADTSSGFENDMGRSTLPLPFLRRKLTKHLCFVGDDLKFSLGIHSHLPRPIAVNGIRLYLVTIEQYENVYRRNGIVSEDDAFRILTIQNDSGDDTSSVSTVDIQPGRNEFVFEWQPMTYNTYVLATVEIQWKEASFFYDSALLRKPMTGLDVRPSEPTQTIELNPLFLIPGHVQNVRLVFHSGSDVITEGVVRLICSEGLMVVPPRTDPSKLDEAWSHECIIPLDACGPGKKIVITTLVKSSNLKHDGSDVGAESSIQTMRAKVETRYRQESYDAVMAIGEEPESDPMKTLLEAMVTTLDRPALAVDDAEAFLFGDDNVMVNISLQCNSPVPFYIKEWHLDLPKPMQVEEDGDLNKGMYRHAISEGEMLLFGFKCVRTDSSILSPGMDEEGEETHCERPLLRVVLQDDFGKTFLQVLPVNLEDIYKKIRKEDIYAELYTATAELTCTADEGTVGHPVLFVYHLNLQSLLTPKQRKRASVSDIGGAATASVCSISGCPILYTIISDNSDWIVSGKVQGLIKLSSQEALSETLVSLHFRGIPTQSGILRNFPELFLEYLPLRESEDPNSHLDSVHSSPPITVQCKNPDCFQSFAYTTSLSLAIPATVEEF